jgi:hypothetical protein
MRRNLRATLGALALLVTTVASGLAIGAVAPSAAGATTTTPHMGTTSNGVVAPVSGTTHTDFPDPAVVSSGTANTYYAYSTGTASALGTVPASWTNGGIGGTTIGCSTSSCTDETARTVALSITSAPATITRFWGLEAPSVVYLGGRWVMYYGGVYTAANQIYGAYDATSPTPTSGFTPTSAAPLMYQAGTGGSSDPSAFIRPTGQPWLLWKSATWKGAPKAKLWSMQLTTGGTRMKSGASAYVLANQPAGGWTGTTTVENPQMVWSGGTYYLFYSGGHWTRTTYGEGYLTCTGPTGDSGATCGTPNTHEILSSATNAEGPGGGSLFTTSTGTWLMAFHGWTGTCSVGATTSYYKCPAARQLYVRPVGGLFSTSLPNLSSFTPSASTLSFTGGTVTLTAQATRAVTYMFTASPGITGLPAAVNTTSGTARVTVDLPHNGSSTAKTYTFTVTATGPYGGQATRSVNVVVNPPPPVNATSSPLALNPSNDSLNAVVQGPSGSLYADKAGAGQLWSNTLGTPFGSGSTAPAAVAYNPANGSQDVVVQGAGGQLNYYYRLINTGPWYSGGAFGSNDEGAPAMVYNPANATLNIVVQAPGGQLESYYRTTTGGTWYGPYLFGTNAGSAPAVVYNPVNQTINVVAQTSTGRLESYYATTGVPGWSGPYYFGRTVTGAPSLVYNPLNGTVDVVVQGTGGELQSYYASIGTTWSGASTFATHSATGAPVAAMNTVNGRLTVVVRCSGGQLESFYVTSGSAWSGPSRFGATVVGAPSLAFNALNSSMNVIAPLSNGDEYSFYVAGTNPWGGPYLMGPT